MDTQARKAPLRPIMLPNRQTVVRTLSTILFVAVATTAYGLAPPESQQSVLRDFYNATSGPSWQVSTGWSSDGQISCEAHGITCSAAGDVLEVFLVDNGLSGPLPESLPGLPSLRGLILNRNQLSGAIPADWSNFQSLQLLSLRDNLLEGSLDTALARVKSLKVLDLCHNHLHGDLPPDYLQMPALGTLALCNNNFSGEVPDPSQAVSLYDLDLANNRITGVLSAELFTLPALWRLNLANNSLSGELPDVTADPASIVTLDLSDNAISGTLSGKLNSMPNLASLDLARNQFSGDLHSEVELPVGLRYLNLSGNQLTGSFPDALKNHPGLLGANRDQDPSVDLSWNAFIPDSVDTAWLSEMGMQVSDFVRPVEFVSAKLADDSLWTLQWTAAQLSSSVPGYYRIETADGTLLAKTDSLAETSLTVKTDTNVSSSDFRIKTLAPAHERNPNTVVSAAAAIEGDSSGRWQPPETVHYPSNFGDFARANWGNRPAGTTARVALVETPTLFERSPELTSDGSLVFSTADREGSSDVTLDVNDQNGAYQARFSIVLGPAANRPPSFTPGSDVTVLHTGRMQVIEWASALDDGDNGTQSMQFVIETDQADWFEFAPEVSVPSGTMRFRARAGQVGTATLQVRLKDNGGTEFGGIDQSAVHSLQITLTEDANAVSSNGLASDQGASGGGGAAASLSLLSGFGLALRRRRSTRHVHIQ